MVDAAVAASATAVVVDVVVSSSAEAGSGTTRRQKLADLRSDDPYTLSDKRHPPRSSVDHVHDLWLFMQGARLCSLSLCQLSHTSL